MVLTIASIPPSLATVQTRFTHKAGRDVDYVESGTDFITLSAFSAWLQGFRAGRDKSVRGSVRTSLSLVVPE
jgi:hypothetical protein